MSAPDPFESELQRVKPAQPPADFMARLRESRPAGPRREAAVRTGGAFDFWRGLIRLAVPAMAAVAIAAVVWRGNTPRAPRPGRVEPQPVALSPALNANAVEIDRELVSSFDAVARLPGGEPVRFRCREWVDQVVWRDNARGVVVEQRTPRMEVVPVRFETY